MCTIISILNQKGGVGKTTTCINLAVALVQNGYRVLAVDLDSQANLTMGMGYDTPEELPVKLADLMQAEIAKRTGQAAQLEPESFILTAHGVDIIPSSLELAGVELTLMNTIGRETVLKTFLEPFRTEYDYILIDCLPSLGIFTVNALTASDEVIVPVQAQYFGAKGLEALLQSVASVQKYLNPTLRVRGILITMIDGRSVFQREVGELVQNTFADYTKIFETRIPLSVEVSKQQSKGTPAIYMKKNKVSEAYEKLAQEVVAI